MADHDLSEDTPSEGVPLPPAPRPRRPALVRLRDDPPTWAFGDLRLRRYRTADHPTVLDLHRTGLAQVGLRPGDGVYYEHDFFRMEEIYLGNGGEFLVGEVRDAIVAMGGLRRADLVPAGPDRADDGCVATGASSILAEPEFGVAELVRLRVRPDMQHHGYGAAVMQALEKRAREIGYHTLHGDTTQQQWKATSLYRDGGWTVVRRETIGGIVNLYGKKRLR